MKFLTPLLALTTLVLIVLRTYFFSGVLSPRHQVRSPLPPLPPPSPPPPQFDLAQSPSADLVSAQPIVEAQLPVKQLHSADASPSPPLLAEAAPTAARQTAKLRSKHHIIVGLNRKVYKHDKERHYACPALGSGSSCLFTTERSRFSEAHALVDVLKDARKAARLDFRASGGQLTGVIISEKDGAKAHSAQFRANRYDFEVGYNKATATIWRPFVCNEVSRKTNLTIAQVLLRGPRRLRAQPPSAQGLNGATWPAVSGELAAFVSNCASRERLEYLRELRTAVSLLAS